MIMLSSYCMEDKEIAGNNRTKNIYFSYEEYKKMKNLKA